FGISIGFPHMYLAFCSVFCLTFSPVDLALRRGLLRTAEHGIELHPGHVRFGDIGYMTPCTLFYRRLSGSFLIRLCVVSERKVAPPLGRSESFALYYRAFNDVEIDLKISPA